MIILLLIVILNAINVNATSNADQDDSSLIYPTWALAIFTIIGSGVIAFVTFYFGRKQHKLIESQLAILQQQKEAQEKLNNTTAMLEVFKLLNDEKHRNARKEVFRHRSIKTSKEALPADYESHSTTVRADFDQIGALVKDGLVPRVLFMESFADTAIIVWETLQEDLMEERKKRNNSLYQGSFEWLANEALSYWKKAHPNEPIPKLY